MARLKGGKYLIDLGLIESGEDIIDKFPKDLIEQLKKYADFVSGVFNENVLDFLKTFELYFKDDASGYQYKTDNSIIVLADDYATIKLHSSFTEISDDNDVVVWDFMFEFGVDVGLETISCLYASRNVTLQ